MFATGDRVVYPLHGGAIIKEVQDRVFDNNVMHYYILQMMFESMTVAVPVDNAEKLGLRSIGDAHTMEDIAVALHECPDVQAIKSISWNRRFQMYMDRLKTGSVVEVAKIFKILVLFERAKKISVGERRLLHTTKQILQSEIMLICDIDDKEAEEWLESKCA